MKLTGSLGVGPHPRDIDSIIYIYHILNIYHIEFIIYINFAIAPGYVAFVSPGLLQIVLGFVVKVFLVIFGFFLLLLLHLWVVVNWLLLLLRIVLKGFLLRFLLPLLALPDHVTIHTLDQQRNKNLPNKSLMGPQSNTSWLRLATPYKPQEKIPSNNYLNGPQSKKIGYGSPNYTPRKEKHAKTFPNSTCKARKATKPPFSTVMSATCHNSWLTQELSPPPPVPQVFTNPVVRMAAQAVSMPWFDTTVTVVIAWPLWYAVLVIAG